MFRVGEFSKIARVSKRLLHHYDHIGLFQPSHTDDATGYRTYSAQQLPFLNRILALRDLGFSLEQITQLVQANISNEEINGMLLMRKAELERDVLETERRLRGIEARLIQNQTAAEPVDIVLKETSNQDYLSLHAHLNGIEEGLRLTWEIVDTATRTVGHAALGPFLCVVHGDAFSLENNELELGFLLNKPVNTSVRLADGRALQTRTVPAVATMATAFQSGGPDPILAAFGRIARWIETNNYRMTGPYRELFFDFGTDHSLNDIVVELQVPVEKTTQQEA